MTDTPTKSMGPWSLDELLDRTLPLNRKERYFTGTVLPALIGGDLEHLGRFAALAGIKDVNVRTARNDCTCCSSAGWGHAVMGSKAAADRGRGEDVPRAQSA